jgi:hypothetical protein
VTWDEWEEADTFGDTGGIVDFLDGIQETQDTGIVIETVQTTGQVFVVYTAAPTQPAENTEESDFPEYFLHYVEAAVLARAYGADTDGFIPSLRDYWQMRKEMGLRAIRLFLGQKAKDRKYAMGGFPRARRTTRGPRLPDRYPAV